MNKLAIFCTLLLSLIQAARSSAQTINFNLLMGAGNDNAHGQYNTSYGFIQRLEGSPPAFPPPYTGGTANTFIGANSGNYNTGSNNTALGYNSGGFFLQGSNNVFIGSEASATLGSVSSRSSTVTGNSFLGYQAGYNNQADYNVFMGFQSGFSNTIGIRNVFIGTSTGYANTGGDNAFLGFQAGQLNTKGTDNTFLGSLAGRNNTEGSLNSFIGSYSGKANTTGRLNSFLGYATGSSNTTGGVNTFIGAFAGNANTTGKQNSFLGYSAGLVTTTGSNNTFVGYEAGQNVTMGSNNIIIGPTSGTAITDGSDNVLMGYNSQAEDGLHNATAIGTGSRVAISNALILGNKANIGIGTSAPTARLEVNSEVEHESGIRLSQLTASSPAQLTVAQTVLTVDATGRIVLTQAGHFSVRSVAEWSDQVFSPAYRLQPLSEVAQYIQANHHLPGVPSGAEVMEHGVDAVRMDATLLAKIEELTLHSIQQQKEIEELKRLVKQLLEKR